MSCSPVARPHSLRSSLTQFDTRRARASIVFTLRPMVFVLRKAEILLSRRAPPGCTACTCSSMASPRRRTNIAGLQITVVNGLNNDCVGEIVRFALRNADQIHGVIFQPVMFTGRDERISTEDR